MQPAFTHTAPFLAPTDHTSGFTQPLLSKRKVQCIPEVLTFPFVSLLACDSTVGNLWHSYHPVFPYKRSCHKPISSNAVSSSYITDRNAPGCIFPLRRYQSHRNGTSVSSLKTSTAL